MNDTRNTESVLEKQSCHHLPEELTINDLRDVLKTVWDARTKWYNIGSELRVDPETLDTIKENEKKVEDRLRTMLKTWLRMSQPKPTSAALAEALQSPTVRNGQLHD